MGTTQNTNAFDLQVFLDSAGVAKTVVRYPKGANIFTQGEPSRHVLYIRTGDVKLSVISRLGREAVVGMLGPGEFFGEGCLAGQPVRMGSATAATDSLILLVEKDKMVSLLHREHALSDLLISHVLARTSRIEEDLVDQFFNSSERRLARMLLLLARYGKHDEFVRPVPVVSQETLAEMIGTTRSRVLKVHKSLLTVVLPE